MTKEQFNQIVDEDIPCSLFHVSSTDIDSETGAALDEIILLGYLHRNPELLQFRNLSWFVKFFITDNKE